jgi:hypothetical protein
VSVDLLGVGEGVAAGTGDGVAGACAASLPAEQVSRTPQSRARAAHRLDLKKVLIISISFRVVCGLPSLILHAEKKWIIQ